MAIERLWQLSGCGSGLGGAHVGAELSRLLRELAAPVRPCRREVMPHLQHNAPITTSRVVLANQGKLVLALSSIGTQWVLG